MRKTFSDESDALTEARRIDALFSNGYSGLTKLPTPEMALLIMQCEQMRVQPHTVMQFYLAHLSTNGSTATVFIKDAGNAFVATRADQEKFSDRQHKSVKSHINRLIDAMGDQDIRRPTLEDLDRYIKEDVGGEPKTRWNHITTLISFGRWMRLKKKWFPLNTLCAFEELERPNVPKKRKVVYTPEEMTRILVFTPT